MNDEALEGWTEERLDVSAMERLLAGMLANQLVGSSTRRSARRCQRGST
jgi:hypothetical protein